MDADNCALACGLVSRAYIGQGQAALGARRRQVKALLSSRRLPPRGWDEATIEMLLQVWAFTDDQVDGCMGCCCRHGLCSAAAMAA